MVIDLQKTIVKMWLRRFITLIIFVILAVASIFTLSSEGHYYGLNKYQIALTIVLIYIVIALIVPILELNYVFFSDEGEFIVLRYFSSGYINRKKRVIQIPKKSFTGYEIIKTLNGMKIKIILKQRLKTSEVRYPPVSITLMNKKQRTQMLEALDKYKIS